MSGRATGYGVGTAKINLAPAPTSSSGVPAYNPLYKFGQLIMDEATGGWYANNGNGTFTLLGGAGSGITQLVADDATNTTGPIVTISGGTTGLTTTISGTTLTLLGGPIVPLTWVSTDGTGAPLTMPINSAYVTTGAASFQLNLPTASVVGSQCKVIVSGTGTITIHGSAGGAAGQMNIDGVLSGAGNNFVSTVSPGNSVTFRSIAAGNNQLWIADSVTGGWNPT